MNELELKENLTSFLVANTDYKWDGTDHTFVNIHSGEVYGNDKIVSDSTKQKIEIELSIKLYSVGSIDLLDNNLLNQKIEIDVLIKSIKKLNNALPLLKGLKFENWDKEIVTVAISESQTQYEGILKMNYSLLFHGFNQAT